MIKAVYFDLFFTLIIPAYDKENNEFTILGLSMDEWEKYAEKDSLYHERALGLVKSEMEIIDKITVGMPFAVSDAQKKKVLAARENRMKAALQNVSGDIIDTLKTLKSQNVRLGLISNADVIDCKHWEQSTLYPYFDDAVFSCYAGLLKPDRRIYELAMRNLNVSPDECLFVGDGGSDELYGAKMAGMKTVFTEALDVKCIEERNRIMEYADYHIREFTKLTLLM
ncbi:MAG: HAD family hydrolase [Bacillus sp. (in: Bacteria)]|nr:HAD family hydrolase [Bacillus sp. (in: firmicutes)]MCM1427906.1 HAD family hydrolase [Eubacterium sp.]